MSLQGLTTLPRGGRSHDDIPMPDLDVFRVVNGNEVIWSMLTDQVDGIFLVNNCSGRFSSSQICKIIFHSSPLHLSGGRGSKYQTAAAKSPVELVKSQTPKCHPEEGHWVRSSKGAPGAGMFNKPPGCPRRSPYLCVLCHLQEDPGSLTVPLILCPCPWEAPLDHRAPGPVSL